MDTPLSELRIDVFAGIGCFLTGSPVQLQDRFDAAFEGAADTAFLLILATAKFAFDLNMSAFLQAGGKFAELSEVEAAMPFGAGFPVTLGILPRAFRRN